MSDNNEIYGVASKENSGFSMIMSYTFKKPGLTWVITHEFGSARFSVSLFDSEDRQFFAGIRKVSDFQIVADLTEPTSGYAIVEFVNQ